MKILTILAAALACIACSADETVERDATVGKEIADDYKRQMDQARAVEDQARKQKQKLDEALKEAEDN